MLSDVALTLDPLLPVQREAVTCEREPLLVLGAAGSVEAIFCLLAMRDGMVPPTINLENPDVITQLDLVPLKAQKRTVNIAMSNSFGFGGTNAALILSKV